MSQSVRAPRHFTSPGLPRLARALIAAALAAGLIGGGAAASGPGGRGATARMPIGSVAAVRPVAGVTAQASVTAESVAAQASVTAESVAAQASVAAARSVTAVSVAAAARSVASPVAPRAHAVRTLAAGTAKPKAVVIVGPTEGVTSSYKRDANVIVSQLKRLGATVVTVYSPHATWSAVKAAAVNANLLVYLGHGTGWPNPYPRPHGMDPKKDNGFGLNVPTAGGRYTDSSKKYFGEYYIKQLKLAKGAIMIFNHACYTAGSAESGYDKTPTKPFQRADNYASGFLFGDRAVAVLATAGSPESFIAALFNTSNRQTLEAVFWAMPSTFKTYVHRKSSARTSGATVLQAPKPRTRYYDALTGTLTSTTAAWRATWGK